MALALEGRAMKDDIMLGDTPKALNRRRRLKDVKAAGRLWKHATLADIEGLVTVEEIAQMFTFTLVRNPWDRTVSYYHWLKAQTFDHPAVHLAKAVPFAGFLEDSTTQASLRSWPASRYMRDAGGTERCSVYIRLEHFAEDAKPLFDHLGFRLELSHENRSDRTADYMPYYDKRLQNIIAECCSEDIRKFNYSYS